MNSRMILVVIVVAVLVILACLISYNFMEPIFDQKAAEITATVDNRTQVAMASESALAATLTAIPTNTPTVTPSLSPTVTPSPTYTSTPLPTFTPSPTITPTPIPMEIVCQAHARANLMLYEFPSEGQLNNAISVNPRDSIDIKGHAIGLDWYLVSYSGQTGWAKIDDLELIAPSCQPQDYTLSYLMGLEFSSNSTQVVLVETFASGVSSWVDINNRTLSTRDDILTLDGNSALNTASMGDNQPFGHLDNFNMYISFRWAGNSGYGGIRFWAADRTYYEIRIYNDCTVALYDDEGTSVGEKLVSPGQNKCNANFPGFLRISLDNQGNLLVYLNDGSEARFNGLVNQPSGEIQLVASESKIIYDFIVITTQP